MPTIGTMKMTIRAITLATESRASPSRKAAFAGRAMRQRKAHSPARHRLVQLGAQVIVIELRRATR